MWLVDWLRDFLPSCLKPSKKIISSSPTDTDGNNVSTTDNSKPNSTYAKMKKWKTNTNKLDNNIENKNFHIKNTITELDVIGIEKDDFIEPDDNEIQILIDNMKTNNKEEQNTNCNNDGKIQFTLNNVSLNDANNLNQ